MRGATILGALALGASGCDGCQESAAMPDAAEPDAPLDVPDAPPPRCDPSKPFDPPRALTEVNTTGYESGGWLSPDERTLYFSRRVGTDWDIFEAKRMRTDVPFDPPQRMALNTTANDRVPSVTEDGLKLFTSRETGMPFDRSVIMVSERSSTADPFPAPVPFPPVAGGSFDVGLVVLPDRTLLFASNRDENALILYGATWHGSGWNTPVRWPAQFGKTYTGDLRTLYYPWYDGIPGHPARIGVTTRASTSDTFAPGQPVPEITTNQGDVPLWISRDGCVLLYERGIVIGSDDDLYLATKPR